MTLTFNVGEMRIDRVIEQELPGFDPFEFFPNLTQEELDANRAMLEPSAMDPETGLLVFAMQSLAGRLALMPSSISFSAASSGVHHDST